MSKNFKFFALGAFRHRLLIMRNCFRLTPTWTFPKLLKTCFFLACLLPTSPKKFLAQGLCKPGTRIWLQEGREHGGFYLFLINLVTIRVEFSLFEFNSILTSYGSGTYEYNRTFAKCETGGICPPLRPHPCCCHPRQRPKLFAIRSLIYD